MLSRTSLVLALLLGLIRVVQADVAPQTRKLWYAPSRSRAGTLVRLFPGFATSEWEAIRHSRLASRAGNLGKGVFHVFTFDGKAAIAAASSSSLNVLGNVNDAVSDSSSVLKGPLFAAARFSHRIEICTGNLGLAAGIPVGTHILIGANHVGVLIDREEKFTDPGGGGLLPREVGGVMCSPVPVFNREPDSAAIERLQCLADRFHPRYSFWEYNCAGYTKEVLSLGGMGFPPTVNLGIGEDFGIPGAGSLSGSQIRERKELGESTARNCAEHVDDLRAIFVALEEGHAVTGEPWLEKKQTAYSDDARLQIYVSAARGRNAASREWVKESVRAPFDGRTLEQLTPGAKKLIRRVTTGLDDEAMEWLRGALKTSRIF